MADEKLIGLGTCPVCGSARARFTFSKKDLACIVCNACQFQGFARSDNSDMRLRALVKPAAPAAEEKTAPALADPAPDAIEKVASENIEKTKKPEKPGFRWGVLTS